MSHGSKPISTSCLLDSVGQKGRSIVEAIYLIVCPLTETTGEKGTGFLHKSGYVITNWHVVEKCSIHNLIGIGSDGASIRFVSMKVDQDRDLVALMPKEPLEGVIVVKNEHNIQPGIQVATWGYPLGYNGPTPLLTTGYLSGFSDSAPRGTGGPIVKHLVINSAFNPGNSGGPLFISGEDEAVGVVVSKHAPISPFLASAIKALANNKSGVVFTATDGQGNTHQFVESQLVAEVLYYFREMTQVVIGEAIAGSEVIDFLRNNNIPT